ncbi:hypothetical protein T484DRAFT_3637932 [Baffinella frigidus]|nr:hypothetical protein T484DRAFT_3637932 [Cryptophyta sp. CCMP2293]
MVKQSKEERATQKALHYQANRVELAAKQKLYCAKNAEMIREKAALYRAKNAETIKENAARHRAKMIIKNPHWSRDYKRANPRVVENAAIYRARYPRARNPEKAAIYMARYRKLHPEKRSEYERNRRHTDPVYAVSHRLRDRLRYCLRERGTKKLAPSQTLLGCSWQEAVDHLESNDRGLKLLDANVHVDHIRPISSFGDLTCLTQQFLVNHWCNLQLLPAVENLQKGADFDYDAWSITDAGRMLLALECELRAAAANAVSGGVLRETDEDDDDEASDDEDSDDDDDEDSDDDDDSGE